MLSGFKNIPFNDEKALLKNIDKETAAILIEPVQGEGGIKPASIKFLKLIKEVCKKNNIRVNTFMIASDPYLMEFVEKFTEINDGSAYFADLNDLGSMVLKDYSKNKIKKY